MASSVAGDSNHMKVPEASLSCDIDKLSIRDDANTNESKNSDKVSKECKEPEDLRNNNNNTTTNQVSPKESASAKISEWSDWVWSEERQQYYCTRITTKGELEYYYHKNQPTVQVTGASYATYKSYPRATTSKDVYSSESYTTAVPISSSNSRGKLVKGSKAKRSTLATKSPSFVQNGTMSGGSYEYGMQVRRAVDTTALANSYGYGRQDRTPFDTTNSDNYESGMQATNSFAEAETETSKTRFQPREISKDIDASTMRNQYQYATHARLGRLVWVPADRLSAIILSHHLNHSALSQRSPSEAEASCRRIGCDKWTKHLDFGEASFVFYACGDGMGFVVDSSRFPSYEQMQSLEIQSIRYAERHGVWLEDLSFAEFHTATWIYGKANALGSKFNENLTQYAGGLICPHCAYWTPYGLQCTNRRCRASLSTIDESFSTDGEIGRKAMNHSAERARANGLKGPEATVLGMAIVAIIGMFLVGSAVRSAIKKRSK